ncbi:energy transducer TonB [Alteripontixanthobacter muriae]|uniref:energy transducer TonB n=1 Tax=Alteripontixanthobacter muriae TaxID=2705546 RepID=UPI0038BAC43D
MPGPRTKRQSSPSGSRLEPSSVTAKKPNENGNEGVLGLRVSVGPFGEVFRCVVTQSSGFAMFDKRSCDAISVRARFHPALDADQQATTGTFSTSIRWEMPD